MPSNNPVWTQDISGRYQQSIREKVEIVIAEMIVPLSKAKETDLSFVTSLTAQEK
jgi:hypothetical protein